MWLLDGVCEVLQPSHSAIKLQCHPLMKVSGGTRQLALWTPHLHLACHATGRLLGYTVLASGCVTEFHTNSVNDYTVHHQMLPVGHRIGS